MPVLALLTVLLCAWFTDAAPASSQPVATPLPEIAANDNRRAAGVVSDGTLHIHLVVAEGSWHPELNGPQRKILAFAENGHAPSNPGPLIRVREGTRISATVSNRSSTALTLHGLSDRSAAPSELRLSAGATVEINFKVGSAGTYFYWATAGEPLETRTGPDSQLNGAIVVDPAGEVPDDRVFVIGHSSSEGPTGLNFYVINGRSWPDTEPLAYRVGERVRWRWINPTSSQHPLHLHGQYFQVLRDGDNQSDRDRPPTTPSLVVTENLQIGKTMAMEWTPREAGRWLFHCHILFHVIPDNRLPLPQWYAEYADLPHDQHMSGLVLGITITGAAIAPSRDPATSRKLTLTVAERPGVWSETEGLKAPGLGYAIGDATASAPGPALVLTRNQPVEITVVNRLKHATSVHWHGIELESYYDGVPHFNGDDRRRTPYIEPGESFVVRFTPPRAGTFIYHTHFNDFIQLSSGLYGALIVVDASAPFNPEVDHAFVVSRGGVSDERSPVLVNGAVSAAATIWRVGATHRLRLIGITPVQTTRVRLMSGDRILTWRALAKDGADLPSTAAVTGLADVRLSPGETYDFAITPTEPGELRLDVELVSPEQTLKATAPLIIK